MPNDHTNQHRRLSDTEVDAIEKLVNAIKDLSKKVDDNHLIINKKVDDNTDITQKLLRGFVNEDVDGHRLYHGEVIQALADRRKLRQELITHLAKTSAWAAFAGCFIALYHYYVR